MSKAYLILANGKVFEGKSIGAKGKTVGETVFTTGMTGYLETLTDPSYFGQIVTQTFPLVGNYGVINEDFESKKSWVRGYIVRELCDKPSNFRCEGDLDSFLKAQNIVGIAGIDTRELTKILREAGVMNGMILSGSEAEPLNVEAYLDEIRSYKIENAVSSVQSLCMRESLPLASAADASCATPSPRGFAPKTPNGGVTGETPVEGEAENAKGVCSGGETGSGTAFTETRSKPVSQVLPLTGRSLSPTKTPNSSLLTPNFSVCLYDFGAKRNIQRELEKRGCKVTVVPYNTTAEQIKKMAPDGVMLSNGPGDPAENVGVIEEIKKLCETKIPIFGICLGHQMLALARGAKTSKLKYGHRGGNQPVKDLQTSRVFISSQNHGYAVENDTLPDFAKLRFINMNDGTCEGIEYTDIPAFSVQFHPEACSGPHDTNYLFDLFLEMMKKTRA